jgi:hypothetical protein
MDDEKIGKAVRAIIENDPICQVLYECLITRLREVLDLYFEGREKEYGLTATKDRI